MSTEKNLHDRQRPSIWQVIMSILAAAFGVQSQQARARDFTHGNPVVYIIGGIVFVVVFVLILVLVVQLVLRSTGV